MTYIGKILPFRNLFADETKGQTSREDCYAVPNQVLLAVVVAVAGADYKILLSRNRKMNLVIADRIPLVRRVREAVLVSQIFVNRRINFVNPVFLCRRLEKAPAGLVRNRTRTGAFWVAAD